MNYFWTGKASHALHNYHAIKHLASIDGEKDECLQGKRGNQNS